MPPAYGAPSAVRAPPGRPPRRGKPSAPGPTTRAPSAVTRSRRSRSAVTTRQSRPSVTRTTSVGPPARRVRSTVASASRNRTVAPARSRHQPSGTEPTTFAASTTTSVRSIPNVLHRTAAGETAVDPVVPRDVRLALHPAPQDGDAVALARVVQQQRREAFDLRTRL